MGLKAIFKGVADNLFVTFVDAVASATVLTPASTTYDASAGVTTVNTSRSVNMIFTGYSKHDLKDTHIAPTDIKGIIKQVECSAIDENTTVHVIEAGASVVYDVINFTQDPLGVIWTVQLRKS